MEKVEFKKDEKTGKIRVAVYIRVSTDFELYQPFAGIYEARKCQKALETQAENATLRFGHMVAR